MNNKYKLKLKLSLYLIIISFFIMRCNKFTDLNTDTKKTVNPDAGALFATSEKNLMDIMANTNVNRNIFRLFAQHWNETTYTDESNYNIATRTIPDNFAQYFYVYVLNNLVESKNAANSITAISPAEIINKNNKLAQVNILQVYAFSILFELYGDMPYKNALNITNEISPVYDDAKTSYYTLIDNLNSAINNLKTDASNGFGTSDLIYGGSITNWQKFANSLKLRMAIMISGIDKTKATTMATEAVNAGVFASNKDNASFPYLTTTPNTNPLYVDLVQSNRKDFVGTRNFIDTLNRFSDPRRIYFFDTVPVKSIIISEAKSPNKTSLLPGTTATDSIKRDTTGTNGYKMFIGGLYGNASPAANYSNPSTKIKATNFPGLLMDYSEVSFYLAEAREKGLISTSDVKTYYNNGVTASITYWGGSESDATTYLSQSNVKFDTTFTNRTNLQKIALQSWIAFYNRGYEAWTVWRRLGFPFLDKPYFTYQTSDGIPLRFTYPVNEQTRNPINYKAAVSKLNGGDKLTSKLWWMP